MAIKMSKALIQAMCMQTTGGVFSAEFNGSIAFRLGVLYNKMNEVFVETNEKIQELYDKYGQEVVVDGTKKLRIPQSKQKMFEEENEKILTEEVEFDFEPLKFIDIKEARLSPIDVSTLIASGLLKN